MRTILLAILMLGSLTVACSNNEAKDETTGNAPTAARPTSTGESNVATSTADAACAPGFAATPGDSEGVLASGGLDRTYLLHIPMAYNGLTPLPLVINLHGFGSNARDQAAYSRFNPLADSEGFIVVTPDGSGSPPRWNFPGLGDVDDIAFIGALIDELAAMYCMDETRVYAAGMSNGAAISTFIACGLAGRIAAVGAVAATAGPRACPSGLKVPIITFRGTDDACVPYDGGTSQCGMMLPTLAAEEVMRLWRNQNVCDAEPVVQQVTEHVRTTTYTNCSGGGDAVLYTIDGGGHTWPGSVDVPRLGAVTTEIDATALIWNFFQRFTVR